MHNLEDYDWDEHDMLVPAKQSDRRAQRSEPDAAPPTLRSRLVAAVTARVQRCAVCSSVAA